MNHIPVLKNEVLEQFSYLAVVKDGYFVDCTIGAANHSIAIAKRYKIQVTSNKFIGIDKDQEAINLAKTNIRKAGLYDNFILLHDDFNNIEKILTKQNIDSIDGTLIDLGVSSMQLDDKNRGFSFLDPSAELDMRMDKDQEFDAKETVNHYPEERLGYILGEYGEEPFARKIAKNICKFRKNRPIQTVSDVLWILEQSIPLKIQKTGRSHFATNTFRALRIEVNNELGDLSKTLKTIVGYLKANAKLAVISFHSTEDRIIKNTFRELSTECICPPKAPICTCNHKAEVKLITKKPIIPTEKEVFDNPRSRSAKLRVVQKLL